MKEFEKRYIHYGSLECDNKIIGNCRCELITNEVDSDSWLATISAFNGDPEKLNIVLNRKSGLKFITSNDNYSIIIDGVFPSFQLKPFNDEVLKFHVKHYEKHHTWNILKTDKINFIFYIPPVELYKREYGLSKDYKKGLLHGWNGWKKESGDSNIREEWITEIYPIESSLGKIYFSPIVLFADILNEDNYPVITVEQMAIECELTYSNKSIMEIHADICEEIKNYLTILSFIEGDFINWYYCRGYDQSCDNGLISEIEIYNRSKKRKQSKTFSKKYYNYKNILQNSHLNLSKLYTEKSENDKNKINKLIERFIIASRVLEIDTKLIYWHSCLDVIIKDFEGNRQPFSVRVVNACKAMGVEWQDLYPEITDASLSQKADFPINTIRNDMLHHGIYPDNYDKIFIETFKTKALCERFILKMIGMDYKNTGLGIIDKL